MDFIPPHKYLQWNPNTLEEVRRDVNLHRPGEMKEAVMILHEWIQQQPHFKKKDFPHIFLEITILVSKGSIERAKKVIDGMCTIKTLMPQFFGPYNAKVDYEPLWEKDYLAVTPKLTPDNFRIILFKIVGKFDVNKSTDAFYKHIYYFAEYLFMHEFNNGVVVILDLLEVDLLYFWRNFNLFELKTIIVTLLQNYLVRLKKLHIITSSKVIETLIRFFKPFIKDKIIERIVVNKSSDDIITYYPKKILPKDYGGDEKTIEELHEQFLDMLSTDEYMELANSMLEARVDESLRPLGQFNDMYAGTVGSFRSLNVD